MSSPSTINVVPFYPTVTVNSVTNLEDSYNIYYFRPITNGSNCTYILPPITCDGMNFKLIRDDNDTSSSLTVSSSNVILAFNTTSNSIKIGTQKSLLFISYENSWYTTQFIPRLLGINRSIFSVSFTANNGNPYQVFKGDKTSLVCSFSYVGSKEQLITSGYFVVGKISKTSDFTITLCTSSEDIIGSISVTDYEADPGILEFQTMNQTLLPVDLSCLHVYIEIEGSGSNKIGIYSMSIF